MFIDCQSLIDIPTIHNAQTTLAVVNTLQIVVGSEAKVSLYLRNDVIDVIFLYKSEI